MLTWIRRITSYFFFTLAILSAALWVRSYYFMDILATGTRNHGVSLSTGIGTIKVERVDARHETRPEEFRRVVPVSYFKDEFDRWFKWKTGFGGHSSEYGFPICFPVLCLALLAIAIRPKPRFKFSLRDLFTLITIAALTIGPLAFWLRSIG